MVDYSPEWVDAKVRDQDQDRVTAFNVHSWSAITLLRIYRIHIMSSLVRSMIDVGIVVASGALAGRKSARESRGSKDSKSSKHSKRIVYPNSSSTTSSFMLQHRQRQPTREHSSEESACKRRSTHWLVQHSPACCPLNSAKLMTARSRTGLST